jgi:hypothetical protein
MPSSGMLGHLALVRTTRHNIPEDGILNVITFLIIIFNAFLPSLSCYLQKFNFLFYRTEPPGKEI